MESIGDCTAAARLDGKCSEPSAVTEVARAYGFDLLEAPELPLARALAAEVLGDEIASLQSYQTVRSHYGAGIYGFREEQRLTGLSASFALNAQGLRQLKRGQLDSLELDRTLLAAPGEAPAAYYGWGFLGVTRRAAANVVILSRAIHRRLFWATPTYTRAVTEAGMRACLSLGFVHAPGAEPTLLWIAPNAFPPGHAR